MRHWQKLTYPVILSIVVVLFSFLIGEIVLRLYQWYDAGVPVFRNMWDSPQMGVITLDRDLGWRATENFHLDGLTKTAHGTEYRVVLSQNQFGFRMYGELPTSKPKILVIGDSFTHAPHVSNDKTYYAVLQHRFDAEVFAIGVSGYGTLQEYMVVDRYFDSIKPDLILWQFCPNDFINNVPLLEKASTVNNNGLRRPYWVNGETIYLLPKTFGDIRQVGYDYSRFFYFLATRLDRLWAVSSTSSVEAEIEQQGRHHEGFAQAVRVTDEIMMQIRRRTHYVPIVAFNSTRDDPYNSAFIEVAARHGIIHLDDLPDVVNAARERGEDLFHADNAHWNETGHQLVGSIIAKHLRAACEEGVITC